MSNKAIRKALEKHLRDFDEFPTAWENQKFAPQEWPYQSVNLLFTAPENPTMGDGFYRQRGFLNIRLLFPINAGPGDAETRAEALRERFKRGLSLVADGVTTIIDRTPEIAPGALEADRYVITVRVVFYANIMGG